MGKPISIKAYLNVKGIQNTGDIYIELKGLKMARKEGVEVAIETYDKIPYLANVTMGIRENGQIILNSLDPNLDFDLLARQITGRNDVTWDSYSAEEDKRIKESREKYEEAMADEAAAHKKERAEIISRLSKYAYGDELAGCSKSDKAGVRIMKSAAEVLEACEAGKTPAEAMEMLKVENPDLVMAFILDKAKNGPNMYEQYMQSTGRDVQTLSENAKRKLGEIKERNARYEAARDRAMSVREYLNLKGRVYTNSIPDAYRALKMAREEGLRVYDVLSDAMPCVAKLPFGQRGDGDIVLSSLDPKLDFDVLVQHLKRKKGLTWEEFEAEETKEAEERAANEERTRKEREAKLRDKKEKAVERMRTYSYGEPMNAYSNPDELSTLILEDAAGILAAYEKDGDLKSAIKKSDPDRTLYSMTLILNVAKNGPELYERYVRDGGLEIENLNSQLRARIASIKARNERYEEDARTHTQFIDTMSNISTDEEFIVVADGTGISQNETNIPANEDVGLPGDGDDII